MPLIKNGQLAEDSWVTITEDSDLPSEKLPIVTLERWQAERESLRGLNRPLGIRLKSDQSPALIAEDLQHFDLVVLEFPKFTDGRAYSSARLLRERYGFEGELRAVGNVLRDQLQFMQRCGFDTYEVADQRVAEAWAKAISEISLVYQPAADARRSILARRQDRSLGQATRNLDEEEEPQQANGSRDLEPVTLAALEANEGPALDCTGR